jgi:tetratricopeptide (TPR) repeat protein
MENLAAILANQKRAEEAIAVYEKVLNLAGQAERPIQIQAHYTYGSGLSILGRPDQAVQQLQQAAQLGFKDADQLAGDEDFKPLRSDPRFPELLASIRKQAK